MQTLEVKHPKVFTLDNRRPMAEPKVLHVLYLPERSHVQAVGEKSAGPVCWYTTEENKWPSLMNAILP